MLSNMPQYVQDNLPGMDEQIARAEQSGVDTECAQLHLARQFCRYEKALKVCKNEFMRNVLEKAKRDVIKLMERG